VTSLQADATGELAGAELGDGSRLAADVAVICLGAIPNVEWLTGSGLAVGPWGVACDCYGRVLDGAGRPVDEIYAAGDVVSMASARFPGHRLRNEHWGAACSQARTVGHNAIHGPTDLRVDMSLPSFWSLQFGMSFKSTGTPRLADELVVVQGSLREGRFVAVYGRGGRSVAALGVNQSHWIPFYQRQIQRDAAFPPQYETVDAATGSRPEPLQFSRSCNPDYGSRQSAFRVYGEVTAPVIAEGLQ
jgi:NADPH-dependent 2,4-dienoyl-CoA reductase/sulfur reductase-like enzyme